MRVGNPATVKSTLFWPLDGKLALASHWVAMSVEMKPCKVCGKTVSPNAKTCPHCGEPEPVVKAEEPFFTVTPDDDDDDDRPVHFQRHLGDDDPLCEVCGLRIKQPQRRFLSGQQTPKVVICPHCGGDPDRIPKPPKPKRPWVSGAHSDEEPIIWAWGRRFLILLFIFAAIMVFIKESSSSP
jgi:hypothetical protein